MFDVGFGELLLVLIIGLIVLGPTRLPEAIKTVVGWIKVLRRLSATAGLELNRELHLQELRELKESLTLEKTAQDDISPSIESEKEHDAN